MRTITALRCERCAYEWLPRSLAKPKACPKCKSRYWDRPRKPAQKTK